ncbi:tRNA lysidine(34) synthetase TilS [Falsihalocynthiibacter arcticus]|uniref:tRNA lysidine(34) synthetase TilS n=1 Tax=Falsihalocynthiibacter arcticus TaxID=1579316 RepID=UPI0030022022
MIEPELHDKELQKALAEKLAPFVGRTLGLAVSGGSDSRALLELAADWARETNSELLVATVDHGLRKEARNEAKWVGEICAQRGIPHDILVWDNWDGQGNLQAQARRARYHLIAEWAVAGGVATVALGHTADDVAETFLMRLARSSGVDGLARMRSEFEREGMLFTRPLLSMRRESLRMFLRERGATWVEDPSNQDSRFERVKMRSVLRELEACGLETKKITQVAENLKQASIALKTYAAKEAEAAMKVEDGDALLDWEQLKKMPEDIQRRLLIGALSWVSPSEYSPRSRALTQVFAQLTDQGTSTLSGCILTLKSNEIRIFRELSAVSEPVETHGSAAFDWDNRWHISGGFPEHARVGALGEQGLAACPEWRASGRKRQSLLSSPSVWVGAELVAAPLAKKHKYLVATPLRDKEDLIRILLSH